MPKKGGREPKITMDTNVDVQYASSEPDLPDRNLLTSWVNAALQRGASENSHFQNFQNFRQEIRKNVELTIRIVDEAEGRQLNEKWRQRPYPTNVLSFPFECPPEIDIPLLGDIIICAPLVACEAVEQHKTLHAHWAHLVIHGTLHLLGYDHISEQQAQMMESIEISALHDLAYPDPYHTAEPL
jgi:probable rRNA maturation factor